MQSLQNFETLFLGLADARAGEHEFRGRYVCAESLLNPVPRMFAARRNPQKTVLSRERRACQNAQQSEKNATGTDFENAGAAPEITKNWCPGASGTVPRRGRPGALRGRLSRRRSGVVLGHVPGAPVTPLDAAGRPRDAARDAPGTPPDASEGLASGASGGFWGPRGPLGPVGVFASQGVGFGSRFRGFFGLQQVAKP